MKIRSALYVGLALLAIFLTSCSGIGTAVVTEVDGQPCFSIPKNWDTRNGIPLYGISVSTKNAADAESNYVDAWSFRMEPPGSSIVALPGKCYRYGVTPTRATQNTYAPLEPYRVYHLFLDGRPANSPLMGYDADFCVKPAANGKTTVLVVPWDDKASQWRYDLCARP